MTTTMSHGYLAESLREHRASLAEVHSGQYKITVRIGPRTVSAVRTCWGWHVALPPKTHDRFLYRGGVLQAVPREEPQWQSLPDRASTIQYLTYRAAGWSW